MHPPASPIFSVYIVASQQDGFHPPARSRSALLNLTLPSTGTAFGDRLLSVWLWFTSLFIPSFIRPLCHSFIQQVCAEGPLGGRQHAGFGAVRSKPTPDPDP